MDTEQITYKRAVVSIRRTKQIVFCEANDTTKTIVVVTTTVITNTRLFKQFSNQMTIL